MTPDAFELNRRCSCWGGQLIISSGFQHPRTARAIPVPLEATDLNIDTS
jgi:hypothetical protein